MPDRWGRAARWAAVHVLIAATAATLLCNDRLFSTWIWHAFVPDPLDNALFFMWQSPPADRMAIWAVQAFVAWLALFASIPALGIALALVVPQHRAWQQCALKWSFYTTVTLVPIVGMWYAWYALFPVFYRVPGPFTIYDIGPAADLPPAMVGTAFGVYWAAGLCSLAYRRRSRIVVQLGEAWRRRPRTGLIDIVAHAATAPCCLAFRVGACATFFVVTWWVLRHVAFPLAGLEALR